MEITTAMTERILIYRLGSIGDTAVAVPCFRLIARVFPEAQRVVLTNFPVHTRESSIQVMLKGTGLIHDCMEYPIATRSVRILAELRARIRRFDPQILVYLAEPRGFLTVWRDVAFFKACGIPRIIGAPLWPDLQRPRYDPMMNSWEQEAHRLSRCLAPLGDARLDRDESWDLALTADELRIVQQRLAEWSGRSRFVAVSVGAKFPVKDWEDSNWWALLRQLSECEPGLGLMLIGAVEDWERSERLAACWRGPKLNLCGELSPRVSAAAMASAVFYLGTDSGPMHLAASSGVPCIAVFSAHKLPGIWYPRGEGHKIFYSRVPCMGCQLQICEAYGKMCIHAIRPEQVLEACLAALATG